MVYKYEIKVKNKQKLAMLISRGKLSLVVLERCRYSAYTFPMRIYARCCRWQDGDEISAGWKGCVDVWRASRVLLPSPQPRSVLPTSYILISPLCSLTAYIISCSQVKIVITNQYLAKKASERERMKKRLKKGLAKSRNKKMKSDDATGRVASGERAEAVWEFPKAFLCKN